MQQEQEHEVQCTYHGCRRKFSPNVFVSLFSLAEQKDKDVFQQVFESLLRSELFCSECSSKHALLLCKNMKAVVEQ